MIILYYLFLHNQIRKQKIDETIKNYNSKPESILSIDYGEKLLDDILLEANAIETGARALNKCVQDLFVRSITRYWVEHINQFDDPPRDRRMANKFPLGVT